MTNRPTPPPLRLAYDADVEGPPVELKAARLRRLAALEGRPYTRLEVLHAPASGPEFVLLQPPEEDNGRRYLLDAVLPGVPEDNLIEVHIAPDASAEDVLTALRVVMAEVACWPTRPPGGDAA